MQILIKSLIFRTLQIYIFSFYAFLFFVSLADAEFREDVLQDFVGGDGTAARDGAEVGDDLADFFAQKVGRKAVGETVEGLAECFAGRRKRFVMAAVRDDRVAVVERFGVDGLPQGVAQGVDTLAVFGRNADNAFGKPPCGRSLVGLVDDGQEFLPGTERKIRGGNRTRERRGVDHMNDDPRPFDARHRALDAHLFEPVVGRADAGRVEEPEKHAADVGALLDHVARGSGDLRDHGPLLVQKSVEQRRFADVGQTDYPAL